MKMFFSVVLIVLLAACAGSPAWTSMQISETRAKAQENNRKIMALKVGDTREQVLKKMGMPAKREAYKLGQNSTVEFLFYRTAGWSTDIATDRDDQFTPLAIRDGELFGWGRNYYQNVVRMAVEITTK